MGRIEGRIAGYLLVRTRACTVADMRPRASSNAARDRGADVGLIAEQRFDVTAPAQHAQDQDIVTVNAVRNHVVSDHKTAHAGSQVYVTATADFGWRPSSPKPAVIESIKRSATSMLLLWVARKYQISSRSESACGARMCISARQNDQPLVSRVRAA